MRAARMRTTRVLAQITPGVSGSWHILRCAAGRERRASDYLADLGFGIYLPQHDTWKGSELERQTALFPGYIFIWLWGLAEHIQDVKSVPDIFGFLANPDGEPILVPDKIIKSIVEIEQRQWVEHLPRSFFRRRRRNEQTWTIPAWFVPNRGFAADDAQVRLGALHKALGFN